jgi:hypothetical protein
MRLAGWGVIYFIHHGKLSGRLSAGQGWAGGKAPGFDILDIRHVTS